MIISILLNLESNKGKNIIRITSKQHWNYHEHESHSRRMSQKLQTKAADRRMEFPGAFPRVKLVRSSGVTVCTKTATEFQKLKSEIISKGHRALIVNMTILETWDETCASYLRRAWLWLPKCVNIRCRVYASDNFHILTIKFKYVWFCSIHSINL